MFGDFFGGKSPIKVRIYDFALYFDAKQVRACALWWERSSMNDVHHGGESRADGSSVPADCHLKSTCNVLHTFVC